MHQLDRNQRRQFLQEAKVQPQVKVVTNQNKKELKSSFSPPPSHQQDTGLVYQLSIPREVNEGPLKARKGGTRNQGKANTRCKRTTQHWLTF